MKFKLKIIIKGSFLEIKIQLILIINSKFKPFKIILIKNVHFYAASS